MKKSIFTFLLFIIFPTFFFAQKTAFKNVHVIPLTEKNLILKNQTVLIDGQKIIAIGNHSSTPIPKNYKIIDGKGNQYLMPGMMDSHSHLPLTQGLDMPMDDYLFLQMANGVTSLRCCRYEKEAMSLRDSLRHNNILAPRLFLSSPMLWATSNFEITFDYSKAEQEIPRFKKEGYDFMKLINGLNPYTHKGILELCKKNDLLLVGHLPRSVGLDYAITSGQDDIEHFQGYVGLVGKNEKQLDSFIVETAKQDIYNCPTIFWYDSNQPFLTKKYLTNLDGLEFIHPEMRKEWETDYDKYRKIFLEKNPDLKNARKDVLKKFSASDAKLLLSHGDGGYCIPGFGMLEEAKIFRDAGIDNYRILESACKNPALFFKQASEWGTVEKNKIADLILLDANPLEDIEHLRKINGVMLQGRWLSSNDIQKGLEKIKAGF